VGSGETVDSGENVGFGENVGSEENVGLELRVQAKHGGGIAAGVFGYTVRPIEDSWCVSSFFFITLEPRVE